MLSNRMDHKTLKLQSLEHHVHRQLKPCLQGRGFLLLAVSGGLDSMALLQVLSRLRVLDLPDVHVAHIHHGHLEYRDQACEFVKRQCEQQKLRFHTNTSRPAEPLESEAELREFRYQQLKKIMQKLEGQYEKSGLLLAAHHWDDQVETRLLRLIRGTGAKGFRAMQFESNDLLRPFLETSKQELTTYAQLLNLEHFEDPSNQSTNALRNWLRQEWLPALEEKQKGAVRRLALSLEKVADAVSTEQSFEKISRAEFSALVPSEKSKLLVRYLDSTGSPFYTSAQVSELVKRLDTPRREHKFHLLKFEWRLNAEHIWIHQD